MWERSGEDGARGEADGRGASHVLFAEGGQGKRGHVSSSHCRWNSGRRFGMALIPSIAASVGDEICCMKNSIASTMR